MFRVDQFSGKGEKLEEPLYTRTFPHTHPPLVLAPHSSFRITNHGWAIPLFPLQAVFHVVLVQPEIPPNTGNVIRLCANTGCALHLIEPLGFPIDHAKMRRAGLDYHEFTAMTLHKNWATFLNSMQASMAAASGSDPQATPSQPPHSNARPIPFSGRLYGLSTSGHKSPYDHRFLPGDCLVFGRETSGLPDNVQDSLGTDHLLRLPMRPHNRSLNLSNAVAVTVFEAWRQQGFEGAAP